MIYRDIPAIDEKPEWYRACSQPLRELLTGDDNEMVFDAMLAHFAKRKTIPDVYARWNGLLLMAAP